MGVDLRWATPSTFGLLPDLPGTDYGLVIRFPSLYTYVLNTFWLDRHASLQAIAPVSNSKPDLAHCQPGWLSLMMFRHRALRGWVWCMLLAYHRTGSTWMTTRELIAMVMLAAQTRLRRFIGGCDADLFCITLKRYRLTPPRCRPQALCRRRRDRRLSPGLFPGSTSDSLEASPPGIPLRS